MMTEQLTELLDIEDDQTTFARISKASYSLHVIDSQKAESKGLSDCYTIRHDRPFTIQFEGPLWSTMSTKPWVGVFERGVLDRVQSLSAGPSMGPADLATLYLRVGEPKPGYLNDFIEEQWDVTDGDALADLHSGEDKELIPGISGFVNGTLRSVIAEVTRTFPNQPGKKAFARWVRGSTSSDEMSTWKVLKIGGTYAQRCLAAQLLSRHSSSKSRFLSVCMDIVVKPLSSLTDTPISRTQELPPRAKPGRYELALYWCDQRIELLAKTELLSTYILPTAPNEAPDGAGRGVYDGPEAAKLNGALAFVEKEFAKIVGMDTVKAQIRSFVFDTFIEEQKRKMANSATAPKKPLYHMAFLGSPGTGKTTMARVVVQVLRKMSIVNDKEEILDTPSPLIGAYVGQTIPFVKAVVEKARGGVVLIDEAHELTESTASPSGGSGASASSGFGQEALNAIMAAMYPDPAVTFIFCGYDEQMTSMMSKNPGFVRRIMYRFSLPDYGDDELLLIFSRMLPTFNEEIEAGALYTVVPQEIASFSTNDKMKRNAGIIEQWLRYARKARNQDISQNTADLARALEYPELMSTLTAQHLQAGAKELKNNL